MLRRADNDPFCLRAGHQAIVAMTIDVEGSPADAVTGSLHLLELCARHGVRGTFFVVGELAEAVPGLVQQIARAGHEIGFHGWRHEFLSTLGPAELARHLREGLPRLEDLAQAPVRGFRAPYFSLTPATAWALPVLAGAGIRYDASIYPAWNDRYGWPGGPRNPARLAGSNLVLYPVPLLCRALPVAFSGGAYLRMLPWRVVAWGFRRQLRQGRPGMIYAHPWEMLPASSWTDEWRAAGSWKRRIRFGRQSLTNRLGRRRVAERLERLFSLASPECVRPMGEVIERLGALPEWRMDRASPSRLAFREEVA